MIDYAQKRQERVFVRSQPAMGVYAIVSERDAIKLRGPATIPSVLSDFVPSEEIRDTPDTDQLIKRKRPPGEFTLTMYAKVPTVPGRFPQWGILARDSFGIEEMELTVVNAAAAGTLTLMIDGAPEAVPAWTPGGTPALTATAIATAIDGRPSVSAVAEGATVRMRRDDGMGEVVLQSTVPSADLGIGRIRYRCATDILEDAFTLVHSTHNAVDYYRDCKVSAVQLVASGSDEANLVFTGFLGNGVSAGQTVVGSGGIAVSTPPTPVTFTLEDAVIQIGPTAEDIVYIQVGLEVFKVTDFDPDTKTVTAIGGQLGTTPAAHAAGDEVLPWLPGEDPDANDLILGLCLGEFTLDGDPYRIISFDGVKDEHLNARLDEAFECALTGYRRDIGGRTVDGTVLAYQRQSILPLTLYGERQQTGAAELQIGSDEGPHLEVLIPKFQIGKVEKGETGGEFTRSFPFFGLASSTPGNDGIELDVVVPAPAA